MNEPENFSQTVTDTGEDVRHGAEKIQERARETWDTVQDQSSRVFDQSADYMRRNPMPFVLGALALGMTIGALSARRPPTFTERYIEEPLQQSRGMLLGVLLAAGALLRRAFRSAAHSVHELDERARDVDVSGTVKPMRKAIRRARGRFAWF